MNKPGEPWIETYYIYWWLLTRNKHLGPYSVKTRVERLIEDVLKNPKGRAKWAKRMIQYRSPNG